MQSNSGTIFSYTLRRAVSIVRWWRVSPRDRVELPEVLIGERNPQGCTLELHQPAQMRRFFFTFSL
ncbi:hypothetical protein E0L21_08125 [Kosakonia quasisacchari]|uniref:Uncharacterized protein n=1 Tax=Kosakonia quasisacchari TaxID=2529380 RepID=A0A4R0HRA1_9ENTR|nr:hypothetical protein E0L21_08125 [Kosakonia quasisacchari]